MHYLYYSAVKKDKDINTPAKAQERANQILESNSFASNEGGYWGASKSDWYVMGGRWSGHLQEIQLKGWDKKARAIISEGKPKGEEKWITNEDVKKHATALQALWLDLGGTGINPWGRDQYRHGGCPDDSQLLSKKLHTALLATTKKKKDEMWGETEVAVMEGDYVEDEMTLRAFLKLPKIIGNYYIVVVDYHN